MKLLSKVLSKIEVVIKKLKIILDKKIYYFILLLIGMIISAVIELFSITLVPIFITSLIDFESFLNFLPLYSYRNVIPVGSEYRYVRTGTYSTRTVYENWPSRHVVGGTTDDSAIRSVASSGIGGWRLHVARRPPQRLPQIAPSSQARRRPDAGSEQQQRD